MSDSCHGLDYKGYLQQTTDNDEKEESGATAVVSGVASKKLVPEGAESPSSEESITAGSPQTTAVTGSANYAHEILSHVIGEAVRSTENTPVGNGPGIVSSSVPAPASAVPTLNTSQILPRRSASVMAQDVSITNDTLHISEEEIQILPGPTPLTTLVENLTIGIEDALVDHPPVPISTINPPTSENYDLCADRNEGCAKEILGIPEFQRESADDEINALSHVESAWHSPKQCLYESVLERDTNLIDYELEEEVLPCEENTDLEDLLEAVYAGEEEIKSETAEDAQNVASLLVDVVVDAAIARACLSEFDTEYAYNDLLSCVSAVKEAYVELHRTRNAIALNRPPSSEKYLRPSKKREDEFASFYEVVEGREECGGEAVGAPLRASQRSTDVTRAPIPLNVVFDYLEEEVESFLKATDLSTYPVETSSSPDPGDVEIDYTWPPVTKTTTFQRKLCVEIPSYAKNIHYASMISMLEFDHLNKDEDNMDSATNDPKTQAEEKWNDDPTIVEFNEEPLSKSSFMNNESETYLENNEETNEKICKRFIVESSSFNSQERYNMQPEFLDKNMSTPLSIGITRTLTTNEKSNTPFQSIDLKQIEQSSLNGVSSMASPGPVKSVPLSLCSEKSKKSTEPLLTEEMKLDNRCNEHSGTIHIVTEENDLATNINNRSKSSENAHVNVETTVMSKTKSHIISPKASIKYATQNLTGNSKEQLTKLFKPSLSNTIASKRSVEALAQQSGSDTLRQTCGGLVAQPRVSVELISEVSTSRSFQPLQSAKETATADRPSTRRRTPPRDCSHNVSSNRTSTVVTPLEETAASAEELFCEGDAIGSGVLGVIPRSPALVVTGRKDALKLIDDIEELPRTVSMSQSGDQLPARTRPLPAGFGVWQSLNFDVVNQPLTTPDVHNSRPISGDQNSRPKEQNEGTKSGHQEVLEPRGEDSATAGPSNTWVEQNESTSNHTLPVSIKKETSETKRNKRMQEEAQEEDDDDKENDEEYITMPQGEEQCLSKWLQTLVCRTAHHCVKKRLRDSLFSWLEEHLREETHLPSTADGPEDVFEVSPRVIAELMRRTHRPNMPNMNANPSQSEVVTMEPPQSPEDKDDEDTEDEEDQEGLFSSVLDLLEPSRTIGVTTEERETFRELLHEFVYVETQKKSSNDVVKKPKKVSSFLDFLVSRGRSGLAERLRPREEDVTARVLAVVNEEASQQAGFSRGEDRRRLREWVRARARLRVERCLGTAANEAPLLLPAVVTIPVAPPLREVLCDFVDQAVDHEIRDETALMEVQRKRLRVLLSATKQHDLRAWLRSLELEVHDAERKAVFKEMQVKESKALCSRRTELENWIKSELYARIEMSIRENEQNSMKGIQNLFDAASEESSKVSLCEQLQDHIDVSGGSDSKLSGHFQKNMDSSGMKADKSEINKRTFSHNMEDYERVALEDQDLNSKLIQERKGSCTIIEDVVHKSLGSVTEEIDRTTTPNETGRKVALVEETGKEGFEISKEYAKNKNIDLNTSSKTQNGNETSEIEKDVPKSIVHNKLEIKIQDKRFQKTKEAEEINIHVDKHESENIHVENHTNTDIENMNSTTSVNSEDNNSGIPTNKLLIKDSTYENEHPKVNFGIEKEETIYKEKTNLENGVCNLSSKVNKNNANENQVNAPECGTVDSFEKMNVILRNYIASNMPVIEETRRERKMSTRSNSKIEQENKKKWNNSFQRPTKKDFDKFHYKKIENQREHEKSTISKTINTDNPHCVDAKKKERSGTCRNGKLFEKRANNSKLMLFESHSKTCKEEIKHESKTSSNPNTKETKDSNMTKGNIKNNYYVQGYKQAKNQDEDKKRREMATERRMFATNTRSNSKERPKKTKQEENLEYKTKVTNVTKDKRTNKICKMHLEENDISCENIDSRIISDAITNENLPMTSNAHTIDETQTFDTEETNNNTSSRDHPREGSAPQYITTIVDGVLQTAIRTINSSPEERHTIQNNDKNESEISKPLNDRISLNEWIQEETHHNRTENFSEEALNNLDFIHLRQAADGIKNDFNIEMKKLEHIEYQSVKEVEIPEVSNDRNLVTPLSKTYEHNSPISSSDFASKTHTETPQTPDIEKSEHIVSEEKSQAISREDKQGTAVSKENMQNEISRDEKCVRAISETESVTHESECDNLETRENVREMSIKDDKTRSIKNVSSISKNMESERENLRKEEERSQFLREQEAEIMEKLYKAWAHESTPLNNLVDGGQDSARARPSWRNASITSEEYPVDSSRGSEDHDRMKYSKEEASGRDSEGWDQSKDAMAVDSLQFLHEEIDAELFGEYQSEDEGSGVDVGGALRPVLHPESEKISDDVSEMRDWLEDYIQAAVTVRLESGTGVGGSARSERLFLPVPLGAYSDSSRRGGTFHMNGIDAHSTTCVHGSDMALWPQDGAEDPNESVASANSASMAEAPDYSEGMVIDGGGEALTGEELLLQRFLQDAAVRAGESESRAQLLSYLRRFVAEAVERILANRRNSGELQRTDGVRLSRPASRTWSLGRGSNAAPFDVADLKEQARVELREWLSACVERRLDERLGSSSASPASTVVCGASVSTTEVEREGSIPQTQLANFESPGDMNQSEAPLYNALNIDEETICSSLPGDKAPNTTSANSRCATEVSKISSKICISEQLSDLSEFQFDLVYPISHGCEPQTPESTVTSKPSSGPSKAYTKDSLDKYESNISPRSVVDSLLCANSDISRQSLSELVGAAGNDVCCNVQRELETAEERRDGWDESVAATSALAPENPRSGSSVGNQQPTPYISEMALPSTCEGDVPEEDEIKKEEEMLQLDLAMERGLEHGDTEEVDSPPEPPEPPTHKSMESLHEPRDVSSSVELGVVPRSRSLIGTVSSTTNSGFQITNRDHDVLEDISGCALTLVSSAVDIVRSILDGVISTVVNPEPHDTQMIQDNVFSSPFSSGLSPVRLTDTNTGHLSFTLCRAPSDVGSITSLSENITNSYATFFDFDPSITVTPREVNVSSVNSTDIPMCGTRRDPSTFETVSFVRAMNTGALGNSLSSETHTSRSSLNDFTEEDHMLRIPLQRQPQSVGPEEMEGHQVNQNVSEIDELTDSDPINLGIRVSWVTVRASSENMRSSDDFHMSCGFHDRDVSMLERLSYLHSEDSDDKINLRNLFDDKQVHILNFNVDEDSSTVSDRGFISFTNNYQPVSEETLPDTNQSLLVPSQSRNSEGLENNALVTDMQINVETSSMEGTEMNQTQESTLDMNDFSHIIIPGMQGYWFGMNGRVPGHHQGNVCPVHLYGITNDLRKPTNFEYVESPSCNSGHLQCNAGCGCPGDSDSTTGLSGPQIQQEESNPVSTPDSAANTPPTLSSLATHEASQNPDSGGSRRDPPPAGEARGTVSINHQSAAQHLYEDEESHLARALRQQEQHEWAGLRSPVATAASRAARVRVDLPAQPASDCDPLPETPTPRKSWEEEQFDVESNAESNEEDDENDDASLSSLLASSKITNEIKIECSKEGREANISDIEGKETMKPTSYETDTVNSMTRESEFITNSTCKIETAISKQSEGVECQEVPQINKRIPEHEMVFPSLHNYDLIRREILIHYVPGASLLFENDLNLTKSQDSSQNNIQTTPQFNRNREMALDNEMQEQYGNNTTQLESREYFNVGEMQQNNEIGTIDDISLQQVSSTSSTNKKATSSNDRHSQEQLMTLEDRSLETRNEVSFDLPSDDNFSEAGTRICDEVCEPVLDNPDHTMSAVTDEHEKVQVPVDGDQRNLAIAEEFREITVTGIYTTNIDSERNENSKQIMNIMQEILERTFMNISIAENRLSNVESLDILNATVKESSDMICPLESNTLVTLQKKRSDEENVEVNKLNAKSDDFMVKITEHVDISTEGTILDIVDEDEKCNISMYDSLSAIEEVETMESDFKLQRISEVEDSDENINIHDSLTSNDMMNENRENTSVLDKKEIIDTDAEETKETNEILDYLRTEITTDGGKVEVIGSDTEALINPTLTDTKSNADDPVRKNIMEEREPIHLTKESEQITTPGEEKEETTKKDLEEVSLSLLLKPLNAGGEVGATELQNEIIVATLTEGANESSIEEGKYKSPLIPKPSETLGEDRETRGETEVPRPSTKKISEEPTGKEIHFPTADPPVPMALPSEHIPSLHSTALRQSTESSSAEDDDEPPKRAQADPQSQEAARLFTCQPRPTDIDPGAEADTEASLARTPEAEDSEDGAGPAWASDGFDQPHFHPDYLPRAPLDVSETDSDLDDTADTAPATAPSDAVRSGARGRSGRSDSSHVVPPASVAVSASGPSPDSLQIQGACDSASVEWKTSEDHEKSGKEYKKNSFKRRVRKFFAHAFGIKKKLTPPPPPA